MEPEHSFVSVLIAAHYWYSQEYFGVVDISQKLLQDSAGSECQSRELCIHIWLQYLHRPGDAVYPDHSGG